MRASSDHIGRKGRCPVCKSLVEIVAPAGQESLATLRPAMSPRATRDSDSRLSSTNVAAWLPGIIAAGVTLLLYLLVFFPLRGSYLGDLFTARGPMQHCTTLVTCWGLALLALKYLAVRKQMSFAELELELIPLEVGLQITPNNVDQFLGHLAGLNRPTRLSILGRRIQGALEHFKSRTSVPEVQQYLATQAELDASSVDAGYALLRSFIWVIPLLGFIGTVTGISDAVTGLDVAVKKGGGESLMGGLGLVTAGLATAFDTTFLALVMAIVLLFPTESLRKIEYGMLDRIEAFTNESLLRRMVDDQAVNNENLPEVVRDALGAAFREHQRWLAQWQAQVAQLGQAVGADFEVAVGRVQEQISREEVARTASYERLAGMLEKVFAEADRGACALRESEQAISAGTREFLGVAAQIQHGLGENLRQSSQIAEQQNRLLQFYSDSGLGASMMGLADQIGKLAQWRPADGDGQHEPSVTQAASPQPLAEPQSTVNLEVMPGPPRGLIRRIFGR
jgi:biopolymer transport protein ExbB/TolQ